MKNLLLLISGLVFSLFVTGCSHLTEYKVAAFNLPLVQKRNNVNVGEGVYSAIYGDKIHNVYYFYATALGKGEDNKHLSNFIEYNRASVIYSALKYGESNGYKYINFVFPTDSSSTLMLREIIINEEDYLRDILSNRSMVERTELGRDTYMFEEEVGDQEPTTKEVHKIGVMLFKEQPVKYRTFKISKLLDVMYNFYGLKKSKIFNMKAGVKKEWKYTNINSSEADLKKIKVQEIKG